MKLRLLFILLPLALCASCASAFAKGPDKVWVETRPPGALIFLDGNAVGISPASIQIPRNSEGLLEFEKAGYFKTKRDVEKVPNGWFFANTGWLAVIAIEPVLGVIMTVGGFGLDLIQNNHTKYSTDPISVELTPIPSERL